jgi:hypothetical protein
MSRQRSESGPVEAPVSHESASGPGLTNESIDRLLGDHTADHENDEPLPAPMAGIWLGVTIGIAIWAVVAGVWLLVKPG